MKVYLIPGLAADKRVFRHIQLPEGYEPHYLEWMNPEKDETLPQYALRMAGQMDTTQPFILAGLSFGGMLATEIARVHPPVQMILIASIPHSSHLPGYYRWAWRAGLQKLITPSVIKRGVEMKRLLTAESPEDKAIIRQMARDVDPAFIRWALKAIVKWDGGVDLPCTVHIHGTKDIILPSKYTRPSHVVPRGGHLMIFDRAEAVNEILGTILTR
jgi:pimeloyl-ACP methyl ester carboxylesterase